MRYFLITFMRKPGGQIDEQVTVAKKIKPSDLQTCNVILDYARQISAHNYTVSQIEIDDLWVK